MRQESANRNTGEPIEVPRPPAPRYSFREAHWAPKPGLSRVAGFYAAAVRGIASRLSAYVCAPMRSGTCTVEQSEFGVYADALAGPAFLAVLRLTSNGLPGILQLSPELVSGLLALMLGGEIGRSEGAARKLTSIETHVLEAVVELMAHELHDAWDPEAGLIFELKSLANDPETCGISRSDLAVVMSSEMRCRDVAGRLTLLVPAALIRMSTTRPGRKAGHLPPDEPRERIARLALHARVRADVQLQESSVLANDLLQLRPGHVLKLPHPVDKPVHLAINGKPKFKGQIVVSGGTLGFQVQQKCSGETH